MGLRHWERYYRTGAVASCPLGPRGEYTQELRGVWEAFFAALPDGASMLDVGTGNGAVALIARETALSLGRHFEIHATDLAQIDPLRDVHEGARRFGDIRFHPNVATEHLPFGGGTFDAVSGQYALEYTAVDQSLREIGRVLKPGGQALFILHHAQSIVACKARESLQQSSLVLEQTKVFRKLRSHIQGWQRSQAVARKTLAELAQAIDTLRDAARQLQDPLTLDVSIDAVSKLLAARGELSPAALDREITGVEEDVRASTRRLQDLIRYARTDADMQGIAAHAADAGLEIRELALQHHAGDRLVGWRLRLARP